VRLFGCAGGSARSLRGPYVLGLRSFAGTFLGGAFPAAVGFGVAGAPRASRPLPRVAWRLPFVVFWRARLIGASRGLLGGLPLGSGALFGRLWRRLARGRFGRLM
jgi:hypothetical protein